MVKYKPEDYELITTVWYTLEYEDEPSYNRLKFQVDDPEDGKGDNFVFSLTTGPNDPNGSWSCMGNDFSLSINLTNTEPSNPRSCITKQYRRRSYLISVPNGELSAEGFYYDIKNTPSGARDNIIYNVSSGSGIFEDAKIIHITVDNDGSIFGRKYGRRVEVFKLKPKQTEENPPDFSGIWEWKGYAYGNLNGQQIPLDNPLEIISLYEIKQNGRFVEIILRTLPSGPIPERPSLPGVLEPTYNENLQFMGWKLIVADSTFDNGSWSAFATKMENNVVMEYVDTYKESGFQQGNSTQNPLVGYATAKRIFDDKVIIL